MSLQLWRHIRNTGAREGVYAAMVIDPPATPAAKELREVRRLLAEAKRSGELSPEVELRLREYRDRVVAAEARALELAFAPKVP